MTFSYKVNIVEKQLALRHLKIMVTLLKHAVCENDFYLLM